MKSIGVFGWVALLLGVAYDKVASTPRVAVAAPGDQPHAIAAAAVTENGGPLPARISEYVFLHQTRDESTAIHAMADIKACPE